MSLGGTVAAADVTAGTADSEMDPPVAGLEALFTAEGARRHVANASEIGAHSPSITPQHMDQKRLTVSPATASSALAARELGERACHRLDHVHMMVRAQIVRTQNGSLNLMTPRQDAIRLSALTQNIPPEQWPVGRR
jgi:hypothetical protein